jgi:hypothetical protein
LAGRKERRLLLILVGAFHAARAAGKIARV